MRMMLIDTDNSDIHHIEDEDVIYDLDKIDDVESIGDLDNLKVDDTP